MPEQPLLTQINLQGRADPVDIHPGILVSLGESRSDISLKITSLYGNSIALV